LVKNRCVLEEDRTEEHRVIKLAGQCQRFGSVLYCNLVASVVGQGPGASGQDLASSSWSPASLARSNTSEIVASSTGWSKDRSSTALQYRLPA
jgi:hypothetical protein